MNETQDQYWMPILSISMNYPGGWQTSSEPCLGYVCNDLYKERETSVCANRLVPGQLFITPYYPSSLTGFSIPLQGSYQVII
jgi:hypothetical protein